MSMLITYAPLIMHGVLVTLAAWTVTAAGSLIMGTLLGIASSRLCSTATTRSIIRCYTFVTKGIPAYVQILICYFVLPSLLGLQVSGFTAATVALAFCSSGYVTEIIRSCMNAIATGQWEACAALGYSTHQTIAYVIFPQAVRIAMPALVGELEQLLKSTSLLATIGVTEVTRAGMNIISRELNPLPVYAIIAGIYLLFSAFMQGVIISYEQRK